jgi:hypothetical protein
MPILRSGAYFFTDYQGTHTTQGVSIGNIPVPTLAERGGVFDPAALTGSVSGPYFANLLTQKLGYKGTAGEPYTSVFPQGTIPQSVWSEPAKRLLQYIPSPNVGSSQFSTSANAQTVRGATIRANQIADLMRSDRDFSCSAVDEGCDTQDVVIFGAPVSMQVCMEEVISSIPIRSANNLYK